jgi:hypothetical protein
MTLAAGAAGASAKRTDTKNGHELHEFARMNSRAKHAQQPVEEFGW